jgi:hypothetical protein
MPNKVNMLEVETSITRPTPDTIQSECVDWRFRPWSAYLSRYYCQESTTHGNRLYPYQWLTPLTNN